MDTAWDILVVVGLTAFCWSVSSSLDKIARALTRLAESPSKERLGV